MPDTICQENEEVGGPRYGQVVYTQLREEMNYPIARESAECLQLCPMGHEGDKGLACPREHTGTLGLMHAGRKAAFQLRASFLDNTSQHPPPVRPKRRK